MTAASLVLSVLSLMVSLVVGVGAWLVARANLQRQLQVTAREAWMREFRQQFAALVAIYAIHKTEQGKTADNYAEMITGDLVVRLLVAEKDQQNARFVQTLASLRAAPLDNAAAALAEATEAAEDILRRERATIAADPGVRRMLTDIWRKFIATRARWAASPLDNLVRIVRDLFLNVAIFILLFILFDRAVRHADWITHHLSSDQVLWTIMVACFVLFYVRRFFRLGYGFLEFCLGFVIVAEVLFSSPPDPSKSDEAVIKIAAGMYLAIRGIDNSMHWLKPHLGGTPAWVRWIFRSE